MSNEQKVSSNKQKLTSNEQKIQVWQLLENFVPNAKKLCGETSVFISFMASYILVMMWNVFIVLQMKLPHFSFKFILTSFNDCCEENIIPLVKF